LKEGGTMCFIIPNKWMDVLYGQEIKQFLLEHFHIKAVIGFSKNVFPTAQVSTVILLLQKIANPDTTRITQFLNLTSEESKDQLDHLIRDPIKQELIEQLDQDPYIFTNIPGQVQRTIIRQKMLTAEEKWSFKYLLQSEMQRKLIHVPTISLHNSKICRVIGGIKTGANEFFYPTSEEITQFRIEKNFLKSGIKTGRSIPETTIITETDELFLAIPSDLNKQTTPGIWKYIDHGENVLRYPQRPSLKWKPWFTIPPSHQDCPDILFLRHIDSDFRARWNKLGCIVADGVRGIKVFDSSSILFYLGILNSTFFYWQAHIRGRWEGQGDLQLLVYELKEFQIPNILLVSPDKRQKVEHEMQQLLDREAQIIQQLGFQNASRKKRMEMLRLSIEDRQKLDEAVLDTLELSDCYKLLIEETTLLETHRLHKKI